MRRGRNCITLLDEPDSFLHPEWQFNFLRQVFEISDTASKSNHVLMSSHSAATITSAKDNMISLFSVENNKVTVTKQRRADIVRSLSAGMITVTETEARLNINHVLNTTSGAVLFTEGITDELILESAWKKLYGEAKCPFGIQNAFGRTFLRNLFSRDELRTNFPRRVMFAMFDFDEAFDDWNGLQKEGDECIDPSLGLIKQLMYKLHYAILLPVPQDQEIRRQALNPSGVPWGRGSDSHISIEHLFYSPDIVGTWFSKEQTSCGGERIRFTGEKLKFAEHFIPGLTSDRFEILRPMFDFVVSKCTTP